MERLTIEYDGHYVPKELCTIDRLGGADDCDPCHEDCDKDCSKCAVQKCFDKLAEYEDLEEQGLLLKLPCAIGSTVYALTPFCEICEEALDNEYACENCNNENFLTETKFDYEMIPMFGKTIFLTEQEALEKMKGE